MLWVALVLIALGVGIAFVVGPLALAIVLVGIVVAGWAFVVRRRAADTA